MNMKLCAKEQPSASRPHLHHSRHRPHRRSLSHHRPLPQQGPRQPQNTAVMPPFTKENKKNSSVNRVTTLNIYI